MTSSIFFFLFIPLLAFILLLVNFFFAQHNPYQEKNSAFECGFHSFLGQNRTPFSISFFLFALLFLLFDLEILFVYPYIVSGFNGHAYALSILMLFLFVLTLGFLFELGKGALSIDSKQYDVIKPDINKKEKEKKSFYFNSSTTLRKLFYNKLLNYPVYKINPLVSIFFIGLLHFARINFSIIQHLLNLIKIKLYSFLNTNEYLHSIFNEHNCYLIAFLIIFGLIIYFNIVKLIIDNLLKQRKEKFKFKIFSLNAFFDKIKALKKILLEHKLYISCMIVLSVCCNFSIRIIYIMNFDLNKNNLLSLVVLNIMSWFISIYIIDKLKQIYEKYWMKTYLKNIDFSLNRYLIKTCINLTNLLLLIISTITLYYIKAYCLYLLIDLLPLIAILLSIVFNPNLRTKFLHLAINSTIYFKVLKKPFVYSSCCPPENTTLEVAPFTSPVSVDPFIEPATRNHVRSFWMWNQEDMRHSNALILNQYLPYNIHNTAPIRLAILGTNNLTYFRVAELSHLHNHMLVNNKVYEYQDTGLANADRDRFIQVTNNFMNVPPQPGYLYNSIPLALKNVTVEKLVMEFYIGQLLHTQRRTFVYANQLDYDYNRFNKVICAQLIVEIKDIYNHHHIRCGWDPHIDFFTEREFDVTDINSLKTALEEVNVNARCKAERALPIYQRIMEHVADNHDLSFLFNNEKYVSVRNNHYNLAISSFKRRANNLIAEANLAGEIEGVNKIQIMQQLMLSDLSYSIQDMITRYEPQLHRTDTVSYKSWFID